MFIIYTLDFYFQPSQLYENRMAVGNMQTLLKPSIYALRRHSSVWMSDGLSLMRMAGDDDSIHVDGASILNLIELVITSRALEGDVFLLT